MLFVHIALQLRYQLFTFTTKYLINSVRFGSYSALPCLSVTGTISTIWTESDADDADGVTEIHTRVILPERSGARHVMGCGAACLLGLTRRGRAARGVEARENSSADLGRAGRRGGDAELGDHQPRRVDM